MAELQVEIPEKPTPEKPSHLSALDNSVEKTAQYLPLALQSVEERFPVSFSLIAVVGYIVIAAFGKMDTLGGYLGYLLFLAICLCIYRLVTAKIGKFTWTLIVAVILLLIYILKENGFFVWISNYLI